jgi:hypothetical protein
VSFFRLTAQPARERGRIAGRAEAAREQREQDHAAAEGIGGRGELRGRESGHGAEPEDSGKPVDDRGAGGRTGQAAGFGAYSVSQSREIGFIGSLRSQFVTLNGNSD